MADVTEAVREVPAETSPDFELVAWSVARRAFFFLAILHHCHSHRFLNTFFYVAVYLFFYLWLSYCCATHLPHYFQMNNHHPYLSYNVLFCSFYVFFCNRHHYSLYVPSFLSLLILLLVAKPFAL